MREPDNPPDPLCADSFIVCAYMNVIEQANFLLTRKLAYEALHPETRHGGPRHPRTAGFDHAARHPSFAAAAGMLFGCTPRVVQRLIRIARDIPGDLQAALSATPIANRPLDLYRISLMETPDQRDLLARLDAAARPAPTLDILTGRK